MKTNTMIAAGAALVLAFCLNNSRAQNDAPAPPPAPTAPATPPNQPPNQPPLRRPMLARGRPPRIAVQQTLRDLQQVKISLQGSQDDFGGHKDSAIAACDKATAELEAIMKTFLRPAQQPPGPGPVQYSGQAMPAAPPTTPLPPVAPPTQAPPP